MSSKKPYEARFKAQLALEAIAGKKSSVELSSEYKVPQSTIGDWEKVLRANATDIFVPESEKNKKMKLLEGDIATLQQIIGELTVENNFLKKKLKHVT
jgi:hypothetical protein